MHSIHVCVFHRVAKSVTQLLAISSVSCYLQASSIAKVDDNTMKNEPAKDGSDSEDEFMELHDNSIYGPIGSHVAAVCWFKATQAKSLRQKNGSFSPWFHGIISRK